jgi:predicted DNA-binding ribbon-helix-helix protein
VSAEGIAIQASQTAPLLSEDAAKPEFRVVARGKSRRGIRLERIFWQTAKSIAQRSHTTIGGLVDEISSQQLSSNNLASAIRVACLSWMVRRTAHLEALTSNAVINSILMAVPTPAFALGANKKILAFNSAFQTLVRRQFPVPGDAEQRGDLKLALDMNIAELMERLDQNGNTAVLTGFAIGVGDRRFRGQLNAVKAPSSDFDVVLAFVVM